MLRKKLLESDSDQWVRNPSTHLIYILILDSYGLQWQDARSPRQHPEKEKNLFGHIAIGLPEGNKRLFAHEKS